MVANRLRWFLHVKRRLVDDAIVRKIDQTVESQLREEVEEDLGKL